MQATPQRNATRRTWVCEMLVEKVATRRRARTDSCLTKEIWLLINKKNITRKLKRTKKNYERKTINNQIKWTTR